MQHPVEGYTVEGEDDELIQWIQQNKLLKAKSKLFDHSVDLKELAQLDPNDAKQYAKEELKLNAIDCNRFVKAVKLLSQRAKEQDQILFIKQDINLDIDNSSTESLPPYCEPKPKPENDQITTDEREWSAPTWLKLLRLIWFLIIPLYVVIDICIFIIIASAKEGDTNYECLNNWVYNGSDRYNPKPWMLSAAVFGIMHTLFSFCGLIAHFEYNAVGLLLQTRCVWCASSISLGVFIMSCIGFAMYAHFDYIDNNCKGSDVGKCVLCWSLLRLFGSMIGSIPCFILSVIIFFPLFYQ